MPSLEALFTRYPAHVWRGTQAAPGPSRLSTGYISLDEALGGGWPQGDLVEIVAAGPGLGELTVLIPALAACTHSGGGFCWLPAETLAYAPALLQTGVALERLYMVEVQDRRQRLWAAEHCLRSGACDLALIEGLSDIPDRSLRRLKLAATAGSSTAFLFRDEATAAQASPAGLRLRVRRLPQEPEVIQVTLLKCRGQTARTVRLQIQDADHCSDC